MGRFDNIRAAKPGDTTAAVEIDLKGYTPRKGSSDDLPAGYFRIKCDTAAWQAKKDRPKERNHEWTAHVVEPAEFAGASIITRNPAPDDSDPKQVGLDFLTRMAWAVWQAAGKGAKAADAGPRKYSPKWFVGKEFFVKVKNGEGEYATRGEIDRFLSSEEWATCVKGPLATTGTPKKSPKQESIPDVGADDDLGDESGKAEEPAAGGTDALDGLLE